MNSEQKLSVKNRSTGPVGNRSTGRSTGVVVEIYQSVEKILTGSISDLNSCLLVQNFKMTCIIIGFILDFLKSMLNKKVHVLMVTAY